MRRAAGIVLLLAAMASGQWLETTIDLPSGAYPVALCCNSVDNKVYCANRNDHSVTVIDSMNAIRTSISLPFAPAALCYNASNNKVYCAGNSWLLEIDGATDSILADFAIQNGVTELCLNTVANKIYSGSPGEEILSVFDCDNRSVTYLWVPRSVDAMCYSSQSNRVYCASSTGNMLTVIDGNTNQTVTRVSVSAPRALCYGSANNRVYCVAYRILVFDCSTNWLIDSINGAPSNDYLGYNPIDDKLYFGWYYRAPYLDIWHGQTHYRWVVSDAPSPYCHNPINNKVYAGVFDKVCVVDGASNALHYITLNGGWISGIVHAPPLNRVYVACQNTNQVAVIRDSMVSGVEEGHVGSDAQSSSEPTVMTDASRILRLASSSVYDVQGRRVENPRAGVYFVVAEGPRGLGVEGSRVRKVLLVR
jgi:DNA-binding beta-propeller fold protein YncE